MRQTKTYRRAALMALGLAACPGAMAAVQLGVPAAPAGFAISYNVPVIAQTRTMSCWAAAAAMMIQWKTNIPTSEFAAANAAGDYFRNAYTSNVGVIGPEIGELATKLNMKVEAPANYDAQGYRALLAHGPLWVGTAIIAPGRVYRHVRIVTGISGDGTTGGSKLDIIDPDGGRRYQSSVANFAKELETIAQQDLGAGGSLFPQVIHYL